MGDHDDNQQESMSEESAPESPPDIDLVSDQEHCSPPGSPSFDIIDSWSIDGASDSGRHKHIA